ncbi:MAG: hypothetical protein K2J08_09325 [Ruminococcus sp.]|nr:hypothetical protein [Ruminococcus sp.]
MDKHRQIAFIVAFIIAMVIMMVGKACTDSEIKKKKSDFGTSQSSYVDNYDNNSYNNYNNVANDNVQTVTPTETQPSVIYVTNMLGNVVGTETTATAPVQTFTDENGVQEVETVQATTDGRSILERYNDEHQNYDNPFNKSDSENPPKKNNSDYQVPSEIHITIN